MRHGLLVHKGDKLSPLVFFWCSLRTPLILMYFHVVSYLFLFLLVRRLIIIVFSIKLCSSFLDVILQVTTPCYLHATVQQKRGKRCLGAQIVHDFSLGWRWEKVGKCIPRNSKHLDFLWFLPFFLDISIWNSEIIWSEWYGLHINTCNFEAVYGAYAFLERNPRPNQMRTQIQWGF